MSSAAELVVGVLLLATVAPFWVLARVLGRLL